MFLNDNATVICLNRSPHLHYIQSMIDRMKSLNTIYVDGYVSILPANWSVGPFLFGPTRHLIAFLNYFRFNFNAQVLYDRFPKYLIDFFKAWGYYYNHSPRKLEIEPTERLIPLDDLVASIVEVFPTMQPSTRQENQ